MAVLRLVAEQPARTPTGAYAGRMYAIAFDMDTKEMEARYGKPNWRTGYVEIRDILMEHGFDDHKQGSVYYGDRDRVRAVTCVIAVQDLARRLPWFKESVRDMRMLRIEEEDDLRQALGSVEPAPSTGSLFDVPQAVREVTGR
jgi:virulence-associated protein VapD